MARKSPVIGDNGLNVSAEDLRQLTKKATEDFLYSCENDVDLHNPEQVKEAIVNYFNGCYESGTRPANMGLYRALGLSFRDMSDILLGKNKSKATPESIVIMKKAIRVLSEYREQIGIQGKINPVTLLFWQKNYDALRDNTQIEVSHENTLTAGLSPEQIARRIEKDIPIDALEGEYKEIETDKETE